VIVHFGDRSFETFTFSKSVHSKGHDRLRLEHDFAAVADGASPLGPGWPDPGDYAEYSLNSLHENGKVGGDARSMWQDAIKRSARWPQFRAKQVSCAVAVVRSRTDRRIEVSVLGDCLVSVHLRQGTAELLTDSTIPRRDDKARAAATDPGDHTSRLLANRLQMNSDAGYWIFAGDPDAADHLVTRSYATGDIERFLVSTDGANSFRTDPHGNRDPVALFTNFGALSPSEFQSWLTHATEGNELDDDIGLIAAWSAG
jgi:hypothetical protein